MTPAEIDRLHDRIYQLEEVLGLKLKLPSNLGLTFTERMILGILVRREVVSQAIIHATLYGDRPECDQPDIKIVDVFICNMRKKLAFAGYNIKNARSVGYYLEEEARTALKRLAA